MAGKHDIDSSIDEPDEEAMQLLELKDAFVGALTANGVLGKIKAQLRASAVSLLRGDPTLAEAAVGRTTAPDRLSLESGVVLLLIHQFLLQHNMTATAGVFEAEGAVREVSRAARDVVEKRFLRGAGASSAAAAVRDDASSPLAVEEPVLTTLVRDALLAAESEAIVTRAHSTTSLTSTFSGLPSGAGTTRPSLPLPTAAGSSPAGEARAEESGPLEGTRTFQEDVEENAGRAAEEEQLETLAFTPAVAQALRQLEESFDFSDVEGPLEKEDEILWDRVDNVA